MSSAAIKLEETIHQAKIIAEIPRLCRERNAVILAHNYQLPEIQELAHYVGDSLALARQAAKTSANIIVFCGVHFMAETAKILNPQKTVLLPDLQAGCSLAESISLAQLQKWKKEYPDALVVSYVNTSAAIKAESDYCCTSGNALQIINSIPADREILFLPDQFLGSWVKRISGRNNMHIWMGECHVHAAIHPSSIRQAKEKYPDAELLIHPECGCLTPYLDHLGQNLNDLNAHVASTEKMIELAQNSQCKSLLVATEEGILHRMKKSCPDKEFISIQEDSTCKYMKRITAEKVYASLVNNLYPIEVDEKTMAQARRAVMRMLATS